MPSTSSGTWSSSSSLGKTRFGTSETRATMRSSQREVSSSRDCRRRSASSVASGVAAERFIGTGRRKLLRMANCVLKRDRPDDRPSTVAPDRPLLSHHVSDPAHRVNERTSTLALELLPEIVDVDVDDVRGWVEFLLP